MNGNGSPAADEPTRVSVGLLPACWRISRSRHRSGITESSAILTIAEGASGENGLNVSASRHLAQFDVYYYAYGFDTGLEEVYYWYPAEDVIVTDIAATYPLSSLREAVLHAQRGGKVLLDLRGTT